MPGQLRSMLGQIWSTPGQNLTDSGGQCWSIQGQFRPKSADLGPSWSKSCLSRSISADIRSMSGKVWSIVWPRCRGPLPHLVVKLVEVSADIGRFREESADVGRICPKPGRFRPGVDGSRPLWDKFDRDSAQIRHAQIKQRARVRIRPCGKPRGRLRRQIWTSGHAPRASPPSATTGLDRGRPSSSGRPRADRSSHNQSRQATAVVVPPAVARPRPALLIAGWLPPKVVAPWALLCGHVGGGDGGDISNVSAKCCVAHLLLPDAVELGTPGLSAFLRISMLHTSTPCLGSLSGLTPAPPRSPQKTPKEPEKKQKHTRRGAPPSTDPTAQAAPALLGSCGA